MVDIIFQLASPERIKTEQTTYSIGLSVNLKEWLFDHAEQLDVSGAEILRLLLLSYRDAIEREKSSERT